jgi:hypothetical protein
MTDTFEVIAYNASGDMLWLNGSDLDVEQAIHIKGVRNVQPFMDSLKCAPRYNHEAGRFTRNRVALIVIRFSGTAEECWVRTGTGELARVHPDGTVIERGTAVAPERGMESATTLGIHNTLRATRSLRRRPRASAAGPERPAQVSARIDEPEQQDQEYVTCPKCNGKQGFTNYRHVPHKHVGGLCYECDGYGVIPVADAAAYLRRQQAAKDARLARERAGIDERKAKESAAHDAAFDRYGDEYRLVYALARYDHRATLGATLDLNAYRANDKAAMRRVRDRLPYMVEDAGLDGLGLEEIEALGTLDPE